MSNTTVGELNIRLNMELARLESQIKQANAKVKAAGGSWHGDISKAAKMINGTLATIGVGASLSGLVAFGKQCIDLGSKITDLSSQAGLTTTAFQVLDLAAMENGATGEEVAAVFAKMNRSMQEAIEGGKSQSEAFDKLNLSAEYLKTLAPEKRFELIARAVIGAKDSQEAYNAAGDIFGAKIGPKMNQLLQEMAALGYDKIAEGNKKMVMTPEQIKALDEAGDAIEKMWRGVKVWAAQNFLEVAGNMDAELDMVEARIRTLEELRAKGVKTYTVNGQSGDVDTAYANFTRMRDRMKGIAPVEVKAATISTDESTMRSEAMAQSMAIIDRFNASEVAYAKEKLKADKESERINDKLAKLGDKQAAAALAALPPADQVKRLKAEEKEIAEILKTVSVDTNEGAERACDLEERRLEIAKELAAVQPDILKSVESQLDAFFGEMDDKSIANIKALNKEAAKTKEFADDIGIAFGNAFESAILDGERVGDMLKGLARDILALIVRQSITAPIAAGISGALSGIKFFADGGEPPVGRPSVIGEEGPELWVPKSAGTVISNSDMAAMSSGGDGGNTSITVVQNFAAGVTQSQLLEGLRQTKQAAIAGTLEGIRRRSGGLGAISV